MDRLSKSQFLSPLVKPEAGLDIVDVLGNFISLTHMGTARIFANDSELLAPFGRDRPAIETKGDNVSAHSVFKNNALSCHCKLRRSCEISALPTAASASPANLLSWQRKLSDTMGLNLRRLSYRGFCVSERRRLS